MLRYHMRSALAFVLIVLAVSTPGAQVRDRAAAAVPAPPSDATLLARGWTALANGQPTEAASAAAQLLARVPWHHSANALRIEALSASDPMKGLDTYEAWLALHRDEDAGLLAPVPRTILLQLATTADPDIRRQARNALRDAGYPQPQQPGERELADQLADAAARVKGGDATALSRLQAVVTAGTADPQMVAKALEAGGPATTPLLVEMLGKPAAPVQAAAAAALGRRKAEEARPTLQKMLKGGDPMARSSAAVALARMGDADGQAFVDKMLQSEVPDLRLMAAEAFDGPGPWMAAVAPLLDNRDGTIRLQAARLVAPVNPDAARRVLSEAAGDPNPVIRSEAVRIMEETSTHVPAVADLGQARRLLRDRDAAVRVYAAGVLLGAARGGA